MKRDARRRLLLASAALVALLLTALPLPGWSESLRPAWIALLVIYSILHEPRRVGLVTAWFAGLLLDTLRGALFGQHALALTVVAFLTLHFHQRIRVFPIGQQTATVFMLAAVYEFLLYWVDGVSGSGVGEWHRWVQVVASAAVWPPLVLTMDWLRSRLELTGSR